MAASVITGLFLFFCLLQSASAERQKQNVTAHPGDDVTLPCKAPNVTITAVEWIRSDLKRHVYMKEDGHLNTTDQDPSYVNRVQLKDDEMKNGELSLILKNVNNNDEGAYVCLYEGMKGTDPIKFMSIVHLDVEGGDAEDGYKYGLLASVILNVVAVLVGFGIYKKLKGRSENNSDLPVNDPDVQQQLQENENSL